MAMLTTMFPIGSELLVSLMFRAGRAYPKECKQTRIDIALKSGWLMWSGHGDGG